MDGVHQSLSGPNATGCFAGLNIMATARSTLITIGAALMVVSALAVFSGRVFRTYSGALETWGGRLFILGALICGSAFVAT